MTGPGPRAARSRPARWAGALRRMMTAPPLSPRFRAVVWVTLLVNALLEVLAVSQGLAGSDREGLNDVLSVSLLVVIVSLRVTWGTVLAFVVAMLAIPSWDPNSFLLGMVLIAAMVARTARRSFAVSGAVLYLVWSVSSAAHNDLHPLSVVGTDLFVVVGALAGWLTRRQGRRLASIEKDLARQEAGRRQAAEAERRQIATELHDVVAHGLTIVAMQSSVLEMVRTADERLTAQRAIGDAARQSLLDLRRMLAVLHGTDRVHGVEGDGMTGSLGDQVAGFGERLRAAGFRVDSRVEELPEAARSLQLTLIRVIQECTTNILKHADPPGAVSIVLEAGDGIDLVIRSPLPARDRQGALPTSGFGLLGMRERVELFDGDLEYGPDGGDWVVRVGFHAHGA